MTTDYDEIADQYRRSKEQPWRTWIEAPSLLNRVGDLSGLRVIDLACGEGYYTRKLAARGAAHVVGVDLSERMIELAQRQEAAAARGIEYRVGDARQVAVDEPFDVVVAAYLLNYARNRVELAEMARAIARCLKPGGRFVTVNCNPALYGYEQPAYEQYGFSTVVSQPVSEGSTVHFELHLPDGTISIENYYLSVDTHEQVLAAEGLTDIRWTPMTLDPRAPAPARPGYWQAFLDRPPTIVLECTRR